MGAYSDVANVVHIFFQRGKHPLAPSCRPLRRMGFAHLIYLPFRHPAEVHNYVFPSFFFKGLSSDISHTFFVIFLTVIRTPHVRHLPFDWPPSFANLHDENSHLWSCSSCCCCVTFLGAVVTIEGSANGSSPFVLNALSAVPLYYRRDHRALCIPSPEDSCYGSSPRYSVRAGDIPRLYALRNFLRLA